MVTYGIIDPEGSRCRGLPNPALQRTGCAGR